MKNHVANHKTNEFNQPGQRRRFRIIPRYCFASKVAPHARIDRTSVLHDDHVQRRPPHGLSHLLCYCLQHKRVLLKAGLWLIPNHARAHQQNLIMYLLSQHFGHYDSPKVSLITSLSISSSSQQQRPRGGRVAENSVERLNGNGAI